MPLAYRHRDEVFAPLPALAGLVVHRELEASVMATLQGRRVEEIQARMDEGHRAYVAVVDGLPAAWGWVATASATIGELKVTFGFSHLERYLWNFVTLSAFRGKGIYPRLLDAIVRSESVDGEGFWIAYAPENHASGLGIAKAGFTVVAELSFDLDGSAVVKAVRPDGAAAASRLLGLPDTSSAVAQCWKCARSEARSASSCASGVCSCDYQRPATLCAA